jgi:hypothetical protein
VSKHKNWRSVILYLYYGFVIRFRISFILRLLSHSHHHTQKYKNDIYESFFELQTVESSNCHWVFWEILELLTLHRYILYVVDCIFFWFFNFFKTVRTHQSAQNVISVFSQSSREEVELDLGRLLRKKTSHPSGASRVGWLSQFDKTGLASAFMTASYVLF